MIHTLLAAAPPPDNCASPESLLPSLYKGLCNGSGEIRFERLTDFIIVLGNVIQLLLTLGGAAAVLIIIWGGIKYVTSEGNPEGWCCPVVLTYWCSSLRRGWAVHEHPLLGPNHRL
jgi:hypothetical protein